MIIEQHAHMQKRGAKLAPRFVLEEDEKTKTKSEERRSKSE
jgi:hypothetical protein